MTINAIDEGMKPLFAQAEREGLWFFCSYQSLWFSPQELREYQAKGRFRWGPVNWQLRSPNDYLKERESEIASKQRELAAAEARVKLAGRTETP